MRKKSSCAGCPKLASASGLSGLAPSPWFSVEAIPPLLKDCRKPSKEPSSPSMERPPLVMLLTPVLVSPPVKDIAVAAAAAERSLVSTALVSSFRLMGDLRRQLSMGGGWILLLKGDLGLHLEPDRDCSLCGVVEPSMRSVGLRVKGRDLVRGGKSKSDSEEGIWSWDGSGGVGVL